MQKIDLANKRFGKLNVLHDMGKVMHGEKTKWFCKCDCGNECIIASTSLIHGLSKSCGCSARYNAIIHGLSYHPLYNIYQDIKKRCYNPNCRAYKNYGGRGIKMCSAWFNDVSKFIAWCMRNGYKSGLFIDRMDNNGNYSPSNCRITTRLKNNRNKRNNRLITYNNQTKCLSEWCEILKLNDKKISARINKLKWSPEKAFITL